MSLEAFLKWTSFNGNSAEDVCIQRVMLDVSSFDRKDTSMWVWAVKTSRPLQLEGGYPTRARRYPTGRTTLEQIFWNDVWARFRFSRLSVKYGFKVNEVIFYFPVHRLGFVIYVTSERASHTRTRRLFLPNFCDGPFVFCMRVKTTSCLPDIKRCPSTAIWQVHCSPVRVTGVNRL